MKSLPHSHLTSSLHYSKAELQQTGIQLATPIFKKGEKSKLSNYHPVSLTSVCCKVLEHDIHNSIMWFFDQHKILSDMQHGFRKQRSCEYELIRTIQDLAKGLDDNTQIDVVHVHLDFFKAFDKVPNQRLDK